MKYIIILTLVLSSFTLADYNYGQAFETMTKYQSIINQPSQSSSDMQFKFIFIESYENIDVTHRRRYRDYDKYYDDTKFKDQYNKFKKDRK